MSLRGGYLLLALVLLGCYLPTLAPGATFSDGPEIVTAIVNLGVIHPTGYPLFTMLAHAFTRLLAVELPACVKVEIFNALCATGAALLTARATADAIEHPIGRASSDDRRRADLAGLLGGALLGLSPLIWEQVRIPEVYPFQLLLVSWAVWALVRFEVSRRSAYLVLAALPMGMGLAHHITMIYLLPAALLYLLARRPRLLVAWLVAPVVALARLRSPGRLRRWRLGGWWALPTACLVGLVPLLSYAYLLWADAHTVALPWGDVSSWERLVDHATGKQYHKFLHARPLDSYWNRIEHLPLVFDRQFLPIGTALFFTGVVVVIVRARKLGLLLMACLLFNVGHGVYYAVGDYANYFIPAMVPCAMFIGIGAWWALGWAASQPPKARRWLCAAVAAAVLGGAAATVLFYLERPRRYPADFAEIAPWAVVLPLAVGAAALATLAGALYRRRHRFARPLSRRALPAVVAAAVLGTLAPAAAMRGGRMMGRAVVGESYGAELAEHIPPGAVLLTQGDGFLFNMWYQHHVHDRGTDFVTLDMGNLSTAWYADYVRTRYPYDCDPLLPEHRREPERYRKLCGSFQARLQRDAKRSWTSLGLRRSLKGARPIEVTAPKLRGNDPGCADPAFQQEHGLFGKECRCYNYGREPGVVEEDCVLSAEDGGIVPRWPEEVRAHRIIEDMIDERPIFERNQFTRWVGNPKDNHRDWNGPVYLRVSGEYELVNRGRYNQIVYYDDVASLSDPCANERLVPIALRPLVPPRSVKPPRVRERYQPNERPTLLRASYLSAEPDGNDDDATRLFEPGQAITMRLEWFERYHYDPSEPDRRGEPIREGVRVCFFDPDGQRIAVESAISGKKRAAVHLPARALEKPGRYTVQACSVGDVGERELPLPEAMPCKRIILEYGFERRGGGGGSL